MLTETHINLIKEAISEMFEGLVVEFIRFTAAHKTGYEWFAQITLDGSSAKAAGTFENDEAKITWWN